MNVLKQNLNKFLYTGNYIDLLPHRKGDPKFDKNAVRSPRTVIHVGRNDPCICGSGKKFKKCCGFIK